MITVVGPSIGRTSRTIPDDRIEKETPPLTYVPILFHVEMSHPNMVEGVFDREGDVHVGLYPGHLEGVVDEVHGGDCPELVEDLPSVVGQARGILVETLLYTGIAILDMAENRNK